MQFDIKTVAEEYWQYQQELMELAGITAIAV